jgi:hypothetical protein
MELIHRSDLASIIADENLNKVICDETRLRIKSKMVNFMLNEPEDEFIYRVEKDRKFKLTRVIKNRYFLS